MSGAGRVTVDATLGQPAPCGAFAVGISGGYVGMTTANPIDGTHGLTISFDVALVSGDQHLQFSLIDQNGVGNLPGLNLFSMPGYFAADYSGIRVMHAPDTAFHSFELALGADLSTVWKRDGIVQTTSNVAQLPSLAKLVFSGGTDGGSTTLISLDNVRVEN